MSTLERAEPTARLNSFTPFSMAGNEPHPRWLPIIYVPNEPTPPIMPSTVIIEQAHPALLPSTYLTLDEIAFRPAWVKEEEQLAAAAGLRLEVKNALYEQVLENFQAHGDGFASDRRPAVDIGIWTATYPPVMFKVFSHLYGVDVDKRLVESANRRHLQQTSFTASLGNALDLPSASDSTYWEHGPPKTAFFIGVADQLTRDETKIALESMKRLVGPGGRIVLGVQNRSCPEVWKLICQGLLQESDPKFDPEELSEIMLSAGLQVKIAGLTCKEGITGKSAAEHTRLGRPTPFSRSPHLDRPGITVFRNSSSLASERNKTVTRHFQYRYPGDGVIPQYPQDVFYLLYEGIVPEEDSARIEPDA